MKITNIKIFTKQRGPVLGYANIILDNKFIIRGNREKWKVYFNAFKKIKKSTKSI